MSGHVIKFAPTKKRKKILPSKVKDFLGKILIHSLFYNESTHPSQVNEKIDRRDKNCCKNHEYIDMCEPSLKSLADKKNSLSNKHVENRKQNNSSCAVWWIYR